MWICRDPLGHLQATGIDDAGRKQYRYHDQWRTARDREKFDDMLEFARALPLVRRRVARDLKADGLGHDQVLACAVRLLDIGFFRIGSEDYAEHNQSYGLATIRKEHVTIEDDEIVFDYPAKSHKRRVHAIGDEAVRSVIVALKRRRGGSPELLAFKDGGRWNDVRSTHVNAYLKHVAGPTVSAKEFRTWNGTVLAAVALATREGSSGSKHARNRTIAAAVKDVAGYLGNTPAIARKSYIDPRVFDRYLSGWTIAPALEQAGGPEAMAKTRKRRIIEEAVIDLVGDPPSQLRASPVVAKAA